MRPLRAALVVLGLALTLYAAVRLTDKTPPSPDSDLPPSDTEKVVTLVEVMSIVGDWSPGYRGGSLLDDAGILSFGTGGIGYGLLVDPENAEAAREVLRRDPVCRPHVMPPRASTTEVR